MKKIALKIACAVTALTMTFTLAACALDTDDLTTGSDETETVEPENPEDGNTGGTDTGEGGNTDGSDTGEGGNTGGSETGGSDTGEGGNTDGSETGGSDTGEGGNTDGSETGGSDTGEGGNTDGSETGGSDTGEGGNTGGSETGGSDTGDDGQDSDTIIPAAFSEAGSFGEGVYATWEATDVDGVTAKYRKHGSSVWTQIDSELIRVYDGVARVDAIGLSAGEYDLDVVFGTNNHATVQNITVSAYDRSGYAHFGYEDGVGAYNDDGTLKDNAVVIYVSEETKNTVTATLNNKEYTGIVNILGNLYKEDNPVVVRVIGQISAATWTPLSGSDNQAVMQKIISYMKTNGLTELSQDEIISLGYNTLDTSQYSVLEGLSSKINYSGGELDSAYNNCNIELASNVTLEGVGEGAELFQWGITWKNCNSIEVRNLTFDDYTEDACSFEGSKNATTMDGFGYGRYWIHNNDFNEGKNYWDVTAEQDKAEGDGATDFKKVAYITISYNHYYQNHKTGLIGGSDSQTTACVTFHHNYYEECNSRLPLGRQANMHMYNNYYSGTTGTNMSLRAGAYAFIENCYFDNAKNPITTQDGDSKRGVAKVYGCVFSGIQPDTETYNVSIVSSRTQTVANDNIFSQNFDTDSTVFYYKDGQTDVESMLTAEQVKELVPELAGTLKANAITIDDGDAGTPDEGETGSEEEQQPESSATYTMTADNFASDNQIWTDMQGGTVYFNADGTYTTDSSSTTGILSFTGKDETYFSERAATSSDGQTFNYALVTGGGTSTTNKRYFTINLSGLQGKNIEITIIATAKGTSERSLFVTSEISNSNENALASVTTTSYDVAELNYSGTINNETLYICNSNGYYFYSIIITVS